MRPIIKTAITQQTIWQALHPSPNPNIQPTPIAHAVLDNRDGGPDDLFIALPGPNDDGHNYIGDALQRGAQAIICEAHGIPQAQANDATIIDCRGEELQGRGVPSSCHPPIAYVVEDSTLALQKVAKYHRLHNTEPNLTVTGITGSVGKSSTKELVAAVLSQGYETLHNEGSLNSEQGLPFTLLSLTSQHRQAVLEMGMYAIGELQTLCELAQPQIGIVTNVGISHLSRLGTVENIARAKAELVQSLPSAPEGGIAILNWDDPRVRAMAHETSARVFSYGLTPEAELWADDIKSSGYNGIRFNLHHHPQMTNDQTINDQRPTTKTVTLPLLGRHHVYTALAATAVGLSQGLGWETILTGLRSLSNQLRLVLTPAIHQATIIDDTYNASPASSRAALDLLADLEPKESGRRIAVLGDMLELGHQTETGHHEVGEYTALVTDLLITVGEWGQQIAQAAHKAGLATQQIHVMPDDRSAIILLGKLLQPDDLVLVKGSRAVGMDKIVNAISAQQEPEKC